MQPLSHELSRAAIYGSRRKSCAVRPGATRLRFDAPNPKMPRMPRVQPPCAPRRPPPRAPRTVAPDHLPRPLRCLSAALALALAAVTGCAGWGYDHVRLGATPREYDRALPAEDVRRTDLGLASLTRSDLRGRTDATVLLWTGDRRIWAKCHVTVADAARSGLRPATFTLRAEIDPAMGGMPGAAAKDALQAIETELATFRGERGVMEAFGWVAAGLRVARFADPASASAPDSHAITGAGTANATDNTLASADNGASPDGAADGEARPTADDALDTSAARRPSAALADYLDRIPPTAAVRIAESDGVLRVELTAR